MKLLAAIEQIVSERAMTPRSPPLWPAQPDDLRIDTDDVEALLVFYQGALGMRRTRLAGESRRGPRVRTVVGTLLMLASWSSMAATSAVDFDRGYRLADQKGCFECHALGRKEVGPSFSSIAEHYRRNPGARDRVEYVVRGGSAGHWGDRFVMWPRAGITDAEARELVEWVLSQ